MRRNAISEFEVERKDYKLKLKRVSKAERMEKAPILANFSPQHLLSAGYAPAPAPAPQAAPASTETPAAPAADDASSTPIKSPMIGTFYRAPSPESSNYVEVGAKVGPETVVCIIEAMKVMNEIKAEVSGVITEILVENGKPVEFDQPMFKVKPA